MSGAKGRIKQLEASADRASDSIRRLEDRIRMLEAYQKSILMPLANEYAKQDGGGVGVSRTRGPVVSTADAPYFTTGPGRTTITFEVHGSTYVDGQLISTTTYGRSKP